MSSSFVLNSNNSIAATSCDIVTVHTALNIYGLIRGFSTIKPNLAGARVHKSKHIFALQFLFY